MKIGLVSEKYADRDIRYNLSVIEKHLKTNKDCDLFLFGESFLHGFDALTWEYEKDVEIAVSLNSDTIAKIQKLAKANKKAVGFGYFEKDDGSLPNLYCSYAIIDKNGELIYNYRRMSKGWKEYWKTCSKYKENDKIMLGTIEGKKFLCFLCGDLWDESILENCKLTAQRNECDFVMWPNCIDYSIEQWEKELPDYAQRIRNLDIPVLLINSHSSTSIGGAIVFQNGKIISQLPFGKIGVLATII